MNTRNLLYIFTCISFSLIIGAGIYEHIALWPIAYSEPPRSLTMFQGDYAIEAAPFWMSVHPLTLVLFRLYWRSERKKHLLLPLIMYIIVLATTFMYFVPELLSLTGTPYSETVDAGIQKRGNVWITLSLIRMGFIVAAAVILLGGLTKPYKKS